MISFRFHVVSITAVFLAIAIGVVVGTTYVDGAVVDGLRKRIDDVSGNLDSLTAENSRLDRQLGDASDFIATSADYAVTNRLTEVPVLLLALRGVDDRAVQEMTRLTRRAGATLPGIVWLEPRWALTSQDDVDALAEIVAVSPTIGVDALVGRAWTTLVEELSAPVAPAEPVPSSTPSSDTTLPSSPLLDEPAAWGALVEAGFLTVDSLADEAPALVDLLDANPRILLVGGTRSVAELDPLLPIVVGATVAGGLPTVVADVYVDSTDGPARGATLAETLGQDLLDVIAVVDDADRSEGQVAAVLALGSVANGVGGHYGYGDGADGVLPSWTPP